ncbi:hypothetical protein PPH41_37625, partial [Burkholderia gladioli]|nr:hypothetical protein [Burkholderia gladioli]
LSARLRAFIDLLGTQLPQMLGMPAERRRGGKTPSRSASSGVRQSRASVNWGRCGCLVRQAFVLLSAREVLLCEAAAGAGPPRLLPVDAVVIVLLSAYAIWLRRTRSRNPR